MSKKIKNKHINSAKNLIKVINYCTAKADVVVQVRWGIVQIQSQEPGIRAIVPSTPRRKTPGQWFLDIKPCLVKDKNNRCRKLFKSFD